MFVGAYDRARGIAAENWECFSSAPPESSRQAGSFFFFLTIIVKKNKRESWEVIRLVPLLTYDNVKRSESCILK